MRARLALASLLLATAAGTARAENVSTSRVTHLALGPSRAPYPMERVDGGRTGRVPSLPADPVPLARRSITGGLDVPIAIAEDTAIVAATASGDLVRLDASGKETWRVRLPSPAAQAPMLASGGTAVVVTESGECVGIDEGGHLRFRLSLPQRGREVKATPVALEDGAIVVAAARSILSIDGDGSITSRAHLPEGAVGDLLADGGDVVITTETGHVLRWHPGSEPQLLGDLGGPLWAPAAIAGGLLAAVIEGKRLVLFDVATGITRASVSSLVLLDGAPSLTADRVWLTSSAGLLLTYSFDGRELDRIALPQLAPAVTSAFGPATTSPALLVTDDGSVGFATNAGEVGVASHGGAKIAEARACSEPLALAAMGKRVVLSCRDGTLVTYGDRTSVPPASP